MPDIPRHQDVDDVLSSLLQDGRSGPCFVARRDVPEKAARLEPFPSWVAPRIRVALAAQGVEALYRHQRLSVDASRAGKDVVVVTPTASGKSLCYHLPVLQAIVEDTTSRAFYLFPTKALSQDQVASLQRVVDGLGLPVRTWTYDGDTPADARTSIRSRGHVIVTNPDMLHAGILPNHSRWRKVLQDLKYIVVDELHTYRGVYGAHVANVLRRLFRLCAFYGGNPRVIACSATIANPQEHAERLLGRPVDLVGPEENGAPAGPRTVLLYNPPVINRELGIRAGVLSQSRRLAEAFVEQGIPTICFTGSRLHTEVLARYLRERLCRAPGTGNRVASYRGGYLPGLRREIERGLREGEITCVVSTNALELGIDIGRLDVAILAGYPGSVASTWQQAGRAGRSGRRAVIVLVGRNTPIDQFIMDHPNYLFEGAPEHARIDPDNLMVLVAHIKCALYELPFVEGDRFGKENLTEVMEFLTEAGLAWKRGDAWHWAAEGFPSDAVSLRSADLENVVIIDTSDGDKVIAETDRLSAQTTVHEGAIYMVESQPYQVDKLDWDQLKAYVRRVDVDHYTTAMSYSRVRVLDCFEDQPRPRGGFRAHGEVHVERKTVGYKKIKLWSSENIGYGDVQLPEISLHTTSFWLSLPGEVLIAAGYRGMELVDGLLGIGRVLQGLAALHLLCDASDLGLAMADPEDNWVAALDRRGQAVVRRVEEGEGDKTVEGGALGALSLQRPTIFLYDSIPGGVGFSERLFVLCDRLLEEARARLLACVCVGGCPSCVGAPGEVEVGARGVALDLLDWLVGVRPRLRGPAERQTELSAVGAG